MAGPFSPGAGGVEGSRCAGGTGRGSGPKRGRGAGGTLRGACRKLLRVFSRLWL